MCPPKVHCWNALNEAIARGRVNTPALNMRRHGPIFEPETNLPSGYTCTHLVTKGQKMKKCSTLAKNEPFFHRFAPPNPFSQAQKHQNQAWGGAPCTFPMSLCLCKFMGVCKTQICGQTVAREVMHIFIF